MSGKDTTTKRRKRNHHETVDTDKLERLVHDATAELLEEQEEELNELNNSRGGGGGGGGGSGKSKPKRESRKEEEEEENEENDDDDDVMTRSVAAASAPSKLLKNIISTIPGFYTSTLPSIRYDFPTGTVIQEIKIHGVPEGVEFKLVVNGFVMEPPSTRQVLLMKDVFEEDGAKILQKVEKFKGATYPPTKTAMVAMSDIYRDKIFDTLKAKSLAVQLESGHLFPEVIIELKNREINCMYENKKGKALVKT